MEQSSKEVMEIQYEKEKQKASNLAMELGDARAEIERLSRQLQRIETSLFWRKTKWIRLTGQKMIQLGKKIRTYRNPKQLLRKLSSKRIERQAMKRYGTQSFPNIQERNVQRETEFPAEISFSILVPLYNTPKKYLQEMMESVRNQTFTNWELCLADGSDGDHNYVGEYAKACSQEDDRIRYCKLEKNEGISGNTNACYQMATKAYIGLFDHDDILHPSVLYEYATVIENQQADYIYCDEATFQKGNINRMITMHFKSDYAIDTLRANNYICHFSVFKRSLLEGTQLFRTQYDGSQDHDMILRLTSLANNVVHVPKLLYYWRSHKGSVASDISAKTYAIEAARSAVQDHLQQSGYEGASVLNTRAFETIFRIKYPLLSTPRISILIPNKDSVEDLRRCIDSILTKSTYEEYEIIIMDNNSETSEIQSYYRELEYLTKAGTARILVLPYVGSFHYSKINNYGAAHATGEYYLLLNNDTQVISPNWMEELLMYAQRSDVGAVGGKLYYEDMTIQHAGIVIGLGAHRSAGHTHYGVAYENVGYMGKLCYTQNVTAVTGACLMVSAHQYEEVGGLDESFAISLNDVDFCLKLREKGYLNIFNPYCELYHYESKSRGLDTTPEKAARYQGEVDLFRHKWAQELEAGDPYYNVNFSLDRSDYALRG
ncbi:MAG: glycosyltransferase family 2 protein [Eubacteriales bacterium]